METPPVPDPARRRRAWLWAAVIVAAGIFIYWPALRGGWLWDDDTEITRNPLLGDPAGWWKAWLQPTGPDYFPLKTTLQWCEWHLWRNQVLYYHLVNVAFHLLGALLLWRVLAKLGLRRPYLGGLLFAIHPVCVESVAWISELKNVMSLPLLLLAMGAWVDWEGRADPPGPPGSPVGPAGPAAPPYLGGRPNELLHRRPEGWSPRYLRALLWFLAALLCKTSAVMFPVVILLYAWWRRGRVERRDVRASLPFFALALALGVVTAWFQSRRAIAGIEMHLGGPLWRLGSAGMAAAFYFFKCLWPVKLLPIYPDWGGRPGWFQPTLCWLLIVLGLSYLGRKRGGFGRPALFGLGFFLINLLPVLGFIPMSFLRISRVSDHLCYLPLVGIVGLGLAALNAGLERVKRGDPTALFGRAIQQRVGDNALHLSIAAIAVVCVFLVFESRRYAQTFSAPSAFWNYAVENNPDAWLAHNNLGNALFDAGEADRATAHYRRAVELAPDYAEAHNNLGNMLLNQGRIAEALAQYREALRILPTYATPQNGIGLALLRTGHAAESIPHFELAVHTEGDFAEAHYNLGLALAKVALQATSRKTQISKLQAAIAQYQSALRLKPAYPAALTDLANALWTVGAGKEAIARYRMALQLSPAYAEAHFNLGVALNDTGDFSGAAAEFETVIRLRPGFAPAHSNLGLVLRALGRPEEAAGQFRVARELLRARAPASR